MSELKTLRSGDEEIVSKDDIEQAESEKRAMSSVAERATGITVESESEYLEAAEILERLRAVKDAVESILEPLRAKAYEHYKDVRDYKKQVLASGEEAIEHVRSEMTRWKETQEEAIEAEKQRLLQEGLDENEEIPDLDEAVPDVDGIHYQERWSAELDGDEDEALEKVAVAIANGDAPVDFIKLNKRRANKMARELQNQMNVPGLTAVRKVIQVDRR